MPAKEKSERYKGYNVKTEAAESHPKFCTLTNCLGWTA